MCGIIGAFENKAVFSIVKKGMSRIKERGRDNAGYYDGKKLFHGMPSKWEKSQENHIIGHNLHSIVGNVPQPLKNEGAALVANCEIYNWKELAAKYFIDAYNDSDLMIKLINKLGVRVTLNKLRGVYAFCYWNGDEVYLARDIIGVKPLWFSIEKGLAFSSEKKALLDEYSRIEELNPREILKYNVKTGKVDFTQRCFFRLQEKFYDDEKSVMNKLKRVLKEALEIRVPDRKFGLLFSGGLDSVIIAKMLKDMGHDFTCYTAAISEDSPDLKSAKEAADLIGLKLKSRIISLDEVDEYLKKVVPLIEDSNVIKVGVALPLYFSCKMAHKDGNRVVFSGSGADEIFAGYNRYKQNPNIDTLNMDLYSDMLKIYEKNTYRDDVITMNNNLELRVPFLDRKLVKYSLNIAPELKLKQDSNGNYIEKYILRQIANEINVPKKLAMRAKKAAQYGSGFDKAITKLAKMHKYKSKSEYLDSFYNRKIMKLGVLLSSGKDGMFAAYTMKNQNYELACAITIASKNESSYMFHTPNVNLVELQAESMGIPIVVQETKGEKEVELIDLKKAIMTAKEKYDIEGVVTGALYSNYQRERIEKICDGLGLKNFSPLWHIDQEFEMRQLLKDGFEIYFSSVAAYGLDKTWVGRLITEKDVDKLVKLNDKVGLNVAGEGGEFESLVVDCPLFSRKIRIEDFEIVVEDENTAAMVVKKAKLVSKK